MCTEAKGSRALGKHGDIWICLIHGTPEPSQKLLIKQITSQNSSSYPRIHPELHWECWQHSGKQRMDFVRGELFLLAQGSTAEIKGSSFDIIHNFDFKKSSTCRLLQRNWEWKIGLCPCTIVWPRAVLCVCALGSLAAAAYGLWSYAGHSVPKGSISLGVGEPGK